MTPSPRSGSSSGQYQPRGGNSRAGAPRTGGFKSGAPKSGGFKSGAPKSGAPRKKQGDDGLSQGALRAAGYNADRAKAASAEGFRSGAPKKSANKPAARKPSQSGAQGTTVLLRGAVLGRGDGATVLLVLEGARTGLAGLAGSRLVGVSD